MNAPVDVTSVLIETPRLLTRPFRKIGCVLSRELWGRGLMPEAVRAVIRYCSVTLGFDFFTCGHFLWNDRSRQVIEKCGFAYWRDSSHRTSLGTEEKSRLYLLRRLGINGG